MAILLKSGSGGRWNRHRSGSGGGRDSGDGFHIPEALRPRDIMMCLLWALPRELALPPTLIPKWSNSRNRGMVRLHGGHGDIFHHLPPWVQSEPAPALPHPNPHPGPASLIWGYLVLCWLNSCFRSELSHWVGSGSTQGQGKKFPYSKEISCLLNCSTGYSIILD